MGCNIVPWWCGRRVRDSEPAVQSTAPFQSVAQSADPLFSPLLSSLIPCSARHSVRWSLLGTPLSPHAQFRWSHVQPTTQSAAPLFSPPLSRRCSVQPAVQSATLQLSPSVHSSVRRPAAKSVASSLFMALRKWPWADGGDATAKNGLSKQRTEAESAHLVVTILTLRQSQTSVTGDSRSTGYGTQYQRTEIFKTDGDELHTFTNEYTVSFPCLHDADTVLCFVQPSCNIQIMSSLFSVPRRTLLVT